MQLMFNYRHRAFVLMLAVVAAAVFTVFISRVFLVGDEDKPYPCGLSRRYEDLSYRDTVRTYHWTMERLTEERMRLYEGSEPLSCGEEDLQKVIPFGPVARSVAARYPHLGDAAAMTYRDFAPLIAEVWRDYDCHLTQLIEHPALIADELIAPPSSSSSSSSSPGEPAYVFTFNTAQVTVDGSVLREQMLAREAFDRLFLTLRTSEEYLPLHASLRCAARGFTDVRNALALFSDASQCLPSSLSQPLSSVLK